MVHALREAHTLLRPGGLLVDLHPAPVHRRVGLVRAGRFHLVGAMRESLEESRLADRAVNAVLRAGLFRQVWRATFELRRSADSLADLQAWFDSYGTVTPLPPHDWLTERVRRAMQAARPPGRIVVTGPLTMRVLAPNDER